MEDSNRQIFAFIGVLIFVTLVAVLVLTSVQNNQTKEQTKVPVEERSVAHELAIFQKGKYVAEDARLVTALAKLLDGIESSTKNSREEIGNLSTEAVIKLKRDYDVEVKLQEFLEEAEKIAKESGPEADYGEIADKVVVILSQEKSEV